MTETTTRRRAPAMSIEQRRAMIVAAALPLVAEHGAAVTTSQIARAAGVGEGTIFRVFADKDEVLQACMAEAMNPDHALRELASIPLDEPLAVRLVQAAEALRAHLERMGTVAATLYTSGHRRDRAAASGPAPGGREASMQVTLEAVTELIEPDRAALRLDPRQVAAAFLGLLFARPLPAGAELTPGDLVGVLLHGACHPAEPSEATR
ncbi:helix-turn-helix domain-containing protein [Nonomuraea sp. NPDC046802]|uniref:TetR/AcrR family transcriptional regulator n=1 Tax=Nonomuraea sp. NPDC046802 TaxID=3154919 RepID=UPI003404B4BA